MLSYWFCLFFFFLNYYFSNKWKKNYFLLSEQMETIFLNFLAQMEKKRKKIHCKTRENKTIWEWMFTITYTKVVCPSACLWSSKAKSDVDVEHASICQVMNWCIKTLPCKFGTDINLIPTYSCFSLFIHKGPWNDTGQKIGHSEALFPLGCYDHKLHTVRYFGSSE